MLKEEILDLIKREQQIKACKEFAESRALPEKCYYLDDGIILCYPRQSGDSRYPYSKDGFTLWAYSSGYFSLNESTYYYILPSEEGKQPYCAFFGGTDDGNGFIPVSITGAARQPIENIERFTIYTPSAVYYVTKTKDIIYFVRAFVSDDKKAVFSVGAINTSDTEKQTYLSNYFNCLCMHASGECCETKWFKQCKATELGFEFEAVENLTRTKRLVNRGTIERQTHGAFTKTLHTCSRSDYCGGMTTTLNCATPLFSGKFEKCVDVCKFGDTAVAGDMYHATLKADDCVVIDYILDSESVTYENGENAGKDLFPAVKALTVDYANVAHSALKNRIETADRSPTSMNIEFGEFEDEMLSGNVFTKFVKSVMRQVEFAALAKNSGVSLLGVRDVFQQIEAALMWNPSDCRQKIIEALGFIDPCGRPPRQYSLPASGALPAMDTRAFIDQGVWIISTLYTYLAHTGDSSILDEECGYYKIVGHNQVEFVQERNSVDEHIRRIANYLINNIDSRTGCLKALYGDWNDALDGLGVSQDGKNEFGNGVSVMTTLQFYKNLEELIEIIDKYGDKHDMRSTYVKARATIEKGILAHAIAKQGGERKILHGWGDNGSYEVGGFNDVDGKSRDGLAATAYFVISNAYLLDKTLKGDILKAFERLDSKYGLKTFEPYFGKDAKGVGRIVDLPIGTAENAATYVHATVFGIWALFMLGESKLAWEQLYKILPLTHEKITTTPFVMSNSYSLNDELNLDGESMSDWFTGSANTLIKAIVRYVFGINPDLNGIRIAPAEFAPFFTASITLSVKGKKITTRLVKGDGKPSITLNGKTLSTTPDKSSGVRSAYIPDELLDLDNTIVVHI